MMGAWAPTKWDKRFLRLAEHVSGWSKDPSTRCGAVIVDADRRVVGMGYNGFPRGVEDLPSRLDDRPVKYELVVHAEVNAIMNAVARTQGCDMYVKGLFCCSRCAGVIIQAGIKSVTCLVKSDSNIQWATSNDLAKMMFTEARVEYRLYDDQEINGA